MKNLRSLAALAALAAVALLAAPVVAQFGPPPGPNQPDRTLDAATRRAVVDTLVDRIERYYVFPEKARETSRRVRRRMAAREYDRITSAKEFADSLTAHVQAVTHDLHLRVHYRYEPLPPMSAQEAAPPESELRRMREMDRRSNYGFEKIECLPGNIGYLDLRQLSSNPDAQQTATAAMNWLANTDALIIDLRRNSGGSPFMIATLLTYLTAPGGRLNFNNFYKREGDKTVQYWTSSFVPGTRYTGKPVYVLTSPLTASAAEEFAYDIQTHKLGTVVGGATAGAAHPGRLYRLGENFAAFIATGRAINPVTNTNWEGVGVKPDVEARPSEALRVAHLAAIDRLMEKWKGDDERVASLKRSREVAEKRELDPEEDFVPPGQRRVAQGN